MIFISAYWKRQAREALRNHWLTALLIALIVNLPALLVQGIAAATGNDLLNNVTGMIYGALDAERGTLDAAALTAGLEEITGSTGIWVMQGLNVAAWLLTPCLTLGMVAWLEKLLRKEEAGDVTAVFSRMRLFLKGIGLRLYVALRVFLWMLPGVALNAAAFLPLWLSDRGSRISVLSAANTSMGLQTAAMVVTAALGIMAALKYALGDMVLADRPAMGPIQAAKESKRLTVGKKGTLFALYASFILWYLLEMLLTSLIADMFGSIPALMTEMLCSLAITVYLNASVTAFYLTAAEGSEPFGRTAGGDPWERPADQPGEGEDR